MIVQKHFCEKKMAATLLLVVSRSQKRFRIVDLPSGFIGVFKGLMFVYIYSKMVIDCDKKNYFNNIVLMQ